MRRSYPFQQPELHTGRFDPPGPIQKWQAEWSWKGHRAHLMFIDDKADLHFQEDPPNISLDGMLSQARHLLDGTVLDGVVITDGEPEPVFLAWDCLEVHGVDIRTMPLYSRQQQMFPMLGTGDMPSFRASEGLPARTWDDVEDLRTRVPEGAADGLILKHVDSTTTVGDARIPWQHWDRRA